MSQRNALLLVRSIRYEEKNSSRNPERSQQRNSVVSGTLTKAVLDALSIFSVRGDYRMNDPVRNIMLLVPTGRRRT
jgi:hypothetical protein